MLRREGLYSSQLTTWRQQLRSQGKAGLESKTPGRKPTRDERDSMIDKFEREKARLERELSVARKVMSLREKRTRFSVSRYRVSTTTRSADAASDHARPRDSDEKSHAKCSAYPEPPCADSWRPDSTGRAVHACPVIASSHGKSSNRCLLLCIQSAFKIRLRARSTQSCWMKAPISHRPDGVEPAAPEHGPR